MISSFSPPIDRRAASEFVSALLDGDPRAGGPGRRRSGLLNKSLASGAEWTECEQATVEIIEATADRVDVLKALFDTEARKPVPAPHGVCELAGEIRQAEAAITKIIATLDPGMTQAKSARHQYAANVRWCGGAAQAPLTSRICASICWPRRWSFVD